MKLAAKPFFNQQNLRGIDDVMLALEELGHDLRTAELQRLYHFNQTYMIITRNVRQQLKLGRFEHPDFLERFDSRFAYYYLHALHRFLTGQQIPRAWQNAFNTIHKPDISPFVCMALGVNAHVNNDIPQVLRDCQATEAHRKDYLLVNKIIRSSLDEVLATFQASNRWTHTDRSVQRSALILGMNHLIRTWRHFAWWRFERLRDNRIDIESIETDADRTARTLTHLPM